MHDGLFKYFNEPQDPDRHGGTIWGHDLHGYPVRAQQLPTLTQDEVENLPLVGDFHCKNFRMWIEEERKEYEEVMDRVANLQWFVRAKNLVDVPAEGAPRIWLEWVQIYAQVPADRGGFRPVVPPPPSVQFPLNGGR